ncbi:peptidylprolyl isomerase [Pelagerythrobacter aerophilus]|uniref:Peptidyl-prolyl cis-trans isomerase n=1 Tax=Pelagerythrobacter aerophilus TaxID=2306995 RepID=A0A418NJK6_9SPHN|nr:peptidylprolyl isomerase [Pelagerythrobacter aerophilus]RIV79473.1 peptidylprolyl isomerase [Pelagerythrobacter aerophilus]
MIRRLIAAGALLSLIAAPTVAAAQDDDALEDSAAAMEEDATAQAAAAPVYAPINYNVEEDRENILLLDLSTGQRVAIRLMPSWAPNHVERVKTLARQGFYDGVIFHRVIDGFMAQTGDPTGTGQGGSQLPDLEEEFNPMPHLRGTVAMARAQSEDSANSQFFIVFYPRFSLDKRYTNFGRVIAGMDAVDAIERGEPPANPTRILQASIAADNKPQRMPQPQLPQPQEITADMLSAPVGESPPVNEDSPADPVDR